MRSVRFADKGISTVQMTKVFANALAHFLFSKGGAVEAAEASSRSAERETPLSAFSFGKLAQRFAASWHEKVVDAINYLILLFAIKVEENNQ